MRKLSISVFFLLTLFALGACQRGDVVELVRSKPRSRSRLDQAVDSRGRMGMAGWNHFIFAAFVGRSLYIAPAFDGQRRCCISRACG